MPVPSMPLTSLTRSVIAVAMATLACLFACNRAQADPVLTGGDRPTLNVEALFNESNPRYDDAVNANARKVLEQAFTEQLSTYEFPEGDITTAGSTMSDDLATAIAGDADVAAGAIRLSTAVGILPEIATALSTVPLTSTTSYVGWKIRSGIRSLFVHVDRPQLTDLGGSTPALTLRRVGAPGETLVVNVGNPVLGGYGQCPAGQVAAPEAGTNFVPVGSYSYCGSPLPLPAGAAWMVETPYTGAGLLIKGGDMSPPIYGTGYCGGSQGAGYLSYWTNVMSALPTAHLQASAPAGFYAYGCAATVATYTSAAVRATHVEPYTSQSYDYTTTTDDELPETAWTPSDVNTWANDPDNEAAVEWLNDELGAPDDADLAAWYLGRFKPVVRYDEDETYRADSVAEITDNYTSSPFPVIDDSNGLYDGTGLIAASNPDLSDPALSLDMLGTIGADARGDEGDGQWIDERNNYATDAQAMHEDSAYADRVYARTVARPGGGWILQYWFFYYYNPKTYLTIGAHEGDWEMIQLEITQGGAPVRATYAQHGGGETCDWVHVPRDSEQRPITYVAEGSHADYFSDGYHFNSGANDDINYDDEEVTDLQLVDVTSSTNQPWILWKGVYGGSDSSPPAPITQGEKWDDPAKWAGDVDGCTEEQTFP